MFNPLLSFLIHQKIPMDYNIMNKHDPLLNILFYIILLIAIIYIRFSFYFNNKDFLKNIKTTR